VGLMGSVADAALSAGGQIVGVMPRSLAEYFPLGGTTLTSNAVRRLRRSP
jgi:predicted Rossmann-fold nucleotide-binding protein